MKDVWEETWLATEVEGAHYVDDVTVPEMRNTVASVYLPEDAAFIAAAPDMARALVAVEWLRDKRGFCTACLAWNAHEDTCPIDTALTKAGIDDAERRRMRGES